MEWSISPEYVVYPPIGFHRADDAEWLDGCWTMSDGKTYNIQDRLGNFKTYFNSNGYNITQNYIDAIWRMSGNGALPVYLMTNGFTNHP